MHHRSTRPLRAAFSAAILAATFLVAAPASAAPQTYTVTKTADTADGTCNADCSLREAITAANANAGQDTVVIPAGTYTLTIVGTGENANATGDLDITDSVIIRGAGSGSTTVDANGGVTSDRAFDVYGFTDVSFTDLEITGGNVSGDGGGIYLDGGTSSGVVLVLNGVLVEGNISSSDGGGLYADYNSNVTILNSTFTMNEAGYGAAVYGYYSNVLARDSVFDDNEASSYGGAFYNDYGNFELWGGSVSENTADYGGAYYGNYAQATFTDSTVDGNTANDYGGAVYNYEGQVHYTNTSLDGNTAESYGGTIYGEYGADILIDSPISNSGLTYTSTMYGGAIYAEYGHNLELIRSPISDTTNTTTSGGLYGGAIYLYEGRLDLQSSPITNTVSSGMTSTTYGGAIYITDGGFFETGSNSITGTEVTSTSSIYGGVLYTEYGGGDWRNDAFSDTMLSNGSSSIYGGVIYAYDAGLGVYGMTFDNNVSDTDSTMYGGVIYTDDYVGLTVHDSTFTNNVGGTGGSSGYGGAIYCYYTGCEIQDSVFDNNSTTYVGGAIAWYESGLVIRRSTFTNNSAFNPDSPGDDTYGGALGSDDYGSLLIENSTLDGNWATWYGGAIYTYDSPLIIRDSVISNNMVDDQETDDSGYGGAIYQDSSNPIIIERSRLSGNGITVDGEAYGGAIYADDGAISLRDTAFTGNFVSSRDDAGGDFTYGGALYVGDGDAPVRAHRTLFANNSATSGDATGEGWGGGIYTDQTTVELENSTLSGNTAQDDGGGIYNDGGGVRLTNVTLANNTAGGASGGAVYNSSGQVAVKASLFSGNTPESCAGDDVESRGYNLADDDSCLLDRGTDDDNTPALIGALANNGGYTRTHALLAASPAIDHAGATCTDITGGYAITMDQRGAGRPGGAACDTGAFEFGVGVTVTATDADASEDGPDKGVFTFARPDGDGPLTVSYTVGGTATSGADYVALTGSVTFADGELTKTVAVTPKTDEVDEGPETVVVTLKPGVLYTVATPSSATVTIADSEVVDEVFRHEGDDRIATAIETSQALFDDHDGAAAFHAGAAHLKAGAVVLARSDDYPDALGGTPLAKVKTAPLLLTRSPAANVEAGLAERTDPRTVAEIDRVLADGGTIYILGESAAISNEVEAELAARWDIVRLGGPTRYETAVEIADAVSATPATIMVTTGENFPDALTAGVAAAETGGVVVLSRGTETHAATTAYIGANPGATVYGVGGPSVAAYPSATAVAGINRFETATLVAEEFFDDPDVVGVARSDLFPDSLGGGAHIAHLGGPLVLSDPASLTAGLGTTGNAFTQPYLEDNAAAIAQAHLYGGPVALSATVASDVLDAIS